MEVLARDLKALGLYTARSLSYEGVEVEIVEHALTPAQTAIYDAYAEADSEALLTRAITLSIAVNHVNRALDLPDIYPFVLKKGVREKLAFAHGHLRQGASAAGDLQPGA